VSSVAGDFTLTVEMVSLSSTFMAPGCRVVIEESTNAFSTVTPLYVFDFGVPVTPSGPDSRSVRRYQVNQTVIGTAGAVVRANIYSLASGTSGQLAVTIES
jgi:hypothetical protein